MTVRVIGCSNVIKYRMSRSCSLLSNLSVAACRRDHRPSLSLPTVSFRDPYPWIVTSSETGTLTDGLVGIHLCRPCHPPYRHDNNPCHCTSVDHRVCLASDPHPSHRHASFVWVGFDLRLAGSQWLCCSHRILSPAQPAGNLKHSVSWEDMRWKRPFHLSSYVDHHR